MGKPIWDNRPVRFSVVSLVALATEVVSIARFVFGQSGAGRHRRGNCHAALGTRVMALRPWGLLTLNGQWPGSVSEFDRTHQPKESSCHGRLPSYLASSSAGDETAAQLGGPMMSRET